RLPRPAPDDLLSGSAPGHALDGPDSLLARRAPRGAAPVRHRDPPRRDGRPRRAARGESGAAIRDPVTPRRGGGESARPPRARAGRRRRRGELAPALQPLRGQRGLPPRDDPGPAPRDGSGPGPSPASARAVWAE